MTNQTHLFFDLDHTLWDFDANSRLVLEQLFDELNLAEISSKSFDVFYPIYRRHNEYLWGLYSQHRIGKARLRLARFEHALRDIGLDDKALAMGMADEYVKRGPHQNKLIDGALETLSALAPHYQMHIVSNGFHEVQELKMVTSGLRPFFEHIITSERASARKPDVRIYRFAEQLAGCEPSQAIMIGDRIETDIAGALSAGWRSVHFDPALSMTAQHRVSHLSEVPALLAQLG